MKNIKLLFQQALMISTGILLIIGIEGLVYRIKGVEFLLPWYMPFSIILTGVLCAVPTMIFTYNKDSKINFKTKIGIHFLLLLMVVSMMGYMFHWYTNLLGYLIVILAYILIYVFVWIGTGFLYRHDENMINKALKDFHDED